MAGTQQYKALSMTTSLVNWIFKVDSILGNLGAVSSDKRFSTTTALVGN